MTDRIDHFAEARRAMNQTLDYSETDENTGALVSIAAAQVHATLALVEQQRIANLIALGTLPDALGGATEAAQSAWDALMEHDPFPLHPDIAAALGIETGADDE